MAVIEHDWYSPHGLGASDIYCRVCGWSKASIEAMEARHGEQDRVNPMDLAVERAGEQP